ncbi:PREDICTED: LOW QUALITY PROTEIN: coiled-coil domain-containing protein C1orf110 homolog [Chrysochloris asiatica]|uniref:LOW QUALITY PROTEIN: coiled-coil domain-containing protein C1orf110 homolog n=1 Tax=Chrysochloris asiatica TaxID=185453 RepID=A0A9B0U4S4_CHRAS|nr:PREDICTED: LOW QUALITY PROTEIN: coiled-coil domain-containing protein C1orf110 homolog [Chrysochloris asiatica]
MDRHLVKGLMHKHVDLEMKTAKQAEFRLNQSTQRLENICLYNMKLLTREQKQVQKELQRLQQADIIQKKLSSYFASGIQELPKDVHIFSPQGRQKQRAPQPNKFRALATKMPQEVNKTKTQMPPLSHSGLKDPMKKKEQWLSQNYRSAHFTKEKPQIQEKDSIKPLKDANSNKDISFLSQDQEVSTSSLSQDPDYSPADESGMTHMDETRPTDANLHSDQDTDKEIPPNPMEAASAGNMNEEATKSTYLELFEKVRNAHYLRHRVPPESERLLSIGEIFGHVKSSPCKEGKEYENRLPSKSLPFQPYNEILIVPPAGKVG